MTRPPVVIIGLMSGTSADGISAAAVRFTHAGTDVPELELLTAVSRVYSREQRARLLSASTASVDELCRLDFELGTWFAEAADAAMKAARLRAEQVRAIASHGHTLWHAPPAATWQIGESAEIAERTGIDVVSDFRVRDVAAGGQGAPLVAIADAMLFAHAQHARALQNLGGIANVSVVPARGAAGEVLAFDTGPGCALIDGVTRRLVPDRIYDVEGRLAAAGQVIEPSLARALTDPFFAAPPPKSTGREHFSERYLDDFIADCRRERPNAPPEDVIATTVALTARSIALAFERFVPATATDVLLSGGGARNPTLVRAIGDVLAPRSVRRFSDAFFDDEAKEAVAFAFLGWLHLEGRPGNLPAATGARGPRLLGKLTPA